MSRLLLDPFREAYMQRALVEVVVLGVLGGVVSVHVLLRKLAFVGDALTHAVFPGVAVAFVVGQSIFLGAIAAGLAAAVLLTVAQRWAHADADATMAVLLGAFFATGVVVVSRSRTYSADLTGLLFGRILAVDVGTIVESAVVAAAVLVAVWLAHRALVLRAFDEQGAAALGYRPVLVDLLLHVAVALVVVASVRAVGTVLVIALVIVPAAAARLLTDRLGTLFALAVAIAVSCGYLGLVASYEASVNHGVRLASGAAIVLAQTTVFAVAGAVAFVRQRGAA